MISKIKRLLTSEKGTVLVLVAFAMIAFAGFIAMVTDAGLLYLNRIKLVNAMDSAVLAGVQELPASPEEALAAASNYAQLNGLNLNDCSFNVADDNRSINGTANRSVGLVFARIMGFNSGKVKGGAAARIAPVTAAHGVVPFGVMEDDFDFGQEIVLKEGAGDGQHKGWFGALSLGGNGACVYRNNINNGYQGVIKIGDIIPTESGNMSGPTQQGVNGRISACHHVPECSPAGFAKDCPRIIIVPIVNAYEVNPGGHTFSVKVVGFGAFLLNEYVGSGNDNQVKGAFIQYVSQQETGDGPDFGLYGSELYE